MYKFFNIFKLYLPIFLVFFDTILCITIKKELKVVAIPITYINGLLLINNGMEIAIKNIQIKTLNPLYILCSWDEIGLLGFSIGANFINTINENISKHKATE